jgi:hypothetical protein
VKKKNMDAAQLAQDDAAKNSTRERHAWDPTESGWRLTGQKKSDLPAGRWAPPTENPGEATKRSWILDQVLHGQTQERKTLKKNAPTEHNN